MQSPFTGGITTLEKEQRILEFRKDSFEIIYHFYLCSDTKEQFTTTEIDNLNINQVHNKYREKYGIPFLDEIRNIREIYGLSAAKMSEVLGLGANIFRNYEAGEMPSVATGRLIRLASDPAEFKKLLEMSKNSLEPHEYERVKKKVESAESECGIFNINMTNWIFSNKYPNIHNGYRVPSLRRVGNMVRYFARYNSPFTTALNKLLFYADFGHFKKHGTSISGMYYKAIQRGPVPENYGSVYNEIINAGYARIEEKDFKDFVGEQFLADSKEVVIEDKELFTQSELETLKQVSQRFLGKNTKQIVHMSHEEPAWKNNVDDFQRISFEYAFRLKNNA